MNEPTTINRYPGGKGSAGVAEKIIREMPPHDVYVEAFAGHAAVFRKKRPARRSLLIDLLPSTACTLQAYTAAHDDGARVILADAVQILPSLPALLDPAALLYCDPPYLGEVRTRLIYEKEFASRAHHHSLLTVLLQARCMTMVSGYYSNLYARMLKGWRLVRYSAMTRGGPREECLWCNFPAPTILHDPRFAGGDFRERERIRRKKQRWAARFANMPATERQAIAAALVECDRAAIEAVMGHVRPITVSPTRQRG